MPALAEVAREKLQALERQGLGRRLMASCRQEGAVITRSGRKLISFSCNDYLGLSQNVKMKEFTRDAVTRYGTGAGASRLITGNHPLYAGLEQKLAGWKRMEAALVFGSGYLASIGILSSLLGKHDLIIADRLAHACILDGAWLSGARLLRFLHNDARDCERLLVRERKSHRNCLIVTEEVFSMDGDLAPLASLKAVAEQYDAWLMADGAHAFSCTSPPVDIYTGTLSKALASYGGYVAAGRDVIDYIASSARSFMFSTGLPPGAVASAIAALDILEEQPELATLPLTKARRFTQAAGLPKAQSAIVPLILGDGAKALAASRILEDEGFLVAAIRPPTVPQGTARLRFTFSALHEDTHIAALARIVTQEGWV